METNDHYAFFNKIHFFTLDDIQLPFGLQIFVKDYDCEDPVEKLYYSCGYEPICINCGWYLANAGENANTYPQCVDCDFPEVVKRS